jgi:polar amino acid transport system substrate-binding protein
MKRLVRTKTLVVVLAVVASLGAACGKSNDKPSAALTALGKALPPAIQKSGVIRVGSDIEYPPIEFFKEGTKQVQGVDWDIAQAMGTTMGVKFSFTNDTDFAGIIGATNSGRFDIIMSAMNDTAERRGQGVDFVDYFLAGSSMLVKKGNPDKIASLDDLCGKSVAVQKGTVQETDVLAPQVTKCAATGHALNVLTFEKDADAVQQVKTSRAVANVEDFPVAAYNALTSGKGADFEIAGSQIGSGPYGIAIPSKNPQLRDAIQRALKAIIASGEYDRILAKWNVTAGALKTAAWNGGA